jgi:hypothetical protein
MSAFQFTNAMRANRLFAIYAQQKNHSELVDFNGLMAGVQLNVYVFVIVISCLLVVLFALIDYARPAHNQGHFECWHILIAVFPTINGHVRKASQKYRLFAIVSSLFVNGTLIGAYQLRA